MTQVGWQRLAPMVTGGGPLRHRQGREHDCNVRATPMPASFA
ncbi:MAG TPA: hypothetical protein VL749_13400 [Patescibacteria group bacterium]|nr:hypothetical protein [Patescibacteria group bacterium]